MSDLRPLNEIAMDIADDYLTGKSETGQRAHAAPYVKAMFHIASCYDMYGMEYGDMVVAYALNNLTQWRGEKARKCKAELKKHLEVYNRGR